MATRTLTRRATGAKSADRSPVEGSEQVVVIEPHRIPVRPIAQRVGSRRSDAGRHRPRRAAFGTRARPPPRRDSRRAICGCCTGPNGRNRTRTARDDDVPTTRGCCVDMPRHWVRPGARSGCSAWPSCFSPPGLCRRRWPGCHSIGAVSRAWSYSPAGPPHRALNPIGPSRGGLVCTVLDSVDRLRADSTLRAGEGYTSVELKVNYLAVRLPAALLPRPGRWSSPGREAVHEVFVTDTGPRAGCQQHRDRAGHDPDSGGRGATFDRMAQIVVVGAGIAGSGDGGGAATVWARRHGHRRTHRRTQRRRDQYLAQRAGRPRTRSSWRRVRSRRPVTAALAGGGSRPRHPTLQRLVQRGTVGVVRRSALTNLADELADGTRERGGPPGNASTPPAASGSRCGRDARGGWCQRAAPPDRGGLSSQRCADDRYDGNTACAGWPPARSTLIRRRGRRPRHRVRHVPLGPDRTYWFATERAPEGRIAPGGRTGVSADQVRLLGGADSGGPGRNRPRGRLA